MVKRVAEYNRHISFYHIDSDNPYEIDDGGNMIPNYTLFKKKWCKKEDTVNANFAEVLNGAETVVERCKISTRYTTEITSDMRFEVDNKVYEVKTLGDSKGELKETIIFGEVLTNGGRN